MADATQIGCGVHFLMLLIMLKGYSIGSQEYVMCMLSYRAVGLTCFTMSSSESCLTGAVIPIQSVIALSIILTWSTRTLVYF